MKEITSRDSSAIILSLFILGIYLAFVVLRYGTLAEAKDAPKAPKSKCPLHWVLKKTSPQYAEYKNARLVEFEDMLCDVGVTKSDHLKALVAGILQENGSLSETNDGDNGCSIGLAQRNTCNFVDPRTGKKFKSADQFRSAYPVWNNYKIQLKWLANDVAWRETKYKGDIFRVVVHHNSPSAAKRGVDSCRKIGKRFSCYWANEVSKHLKDLTSI
jgi:hypothetical protein